MSVSRRELLRGLGAAAFVAAGATHVHAEQGDPDFTFLHLTDMHVTQRRKGVEGYRACAKSVRALKEKPALILTGGDLAFDGLYTDRDVFERDIADFKSITESMGVPAYHCIGNHDVLGWSPRRKVPLDDPELGKTMILKRLGMERSYYGFDHGDWHFAILDSIFHIDRDGPNYEPRIGEEQLHWLARDLGKAGDRPKVVVTHIAAFCNLGTINGDANAKAILDGMVLKDTRDLRRVLERHRVKLVLQGHSHRIESYRYNDVWYLTSPAVSAAWWGGTWNGSPPSYTILRARDGELSWSYQPFDWTIQRDPEDTREEKLQADYDADLAEQARLATEERAGRG